MKIFDGFSPVNLAGEDVLFATPEKALIDTWHWLPGPWTPERHAGMRYENLDIIRPAVLKYWAKAFKIPRLIEATRVFLSQRRESLRERA